MSNFRNEHSLWALVFYEHFSEGASSYTDKTRLINSADSRLRKKLVIMKEQRKGTLDS